MASHSTHAMLKTYFDGGRRDLLDVAGNGSDTHSDGIPILLYLIDVPGVWNVNDASLDFARLAAWQGGLGAVVQPEVTGGKSRLVGEHVGYPVTKIAEALPAEVLPAHVRSPPVMPAPFALGVPPETRQLLSAAVNSPLVFERRSVIPDLFYELCGHIRQVHEVD